MTDKTHNQQAYQLIEAGAITVVKGEANAFEGYLKLGAGLSRLADKFDTPQKFTAELTKLIHNAQAKGKSFHDDHGNLLVGIESNKADATRASNLRKALIWMHEHPKQLAFVQERSASKTPMSLQTVWKKHQTSVIKEGVENNDTIVTIADMLEGVTQKEVKELVKAKKDAIAKASRKKDEAELAAMPDPVADPAVAILQLISGADLSELEALQSMIQKRMIKLKKPAPKAKPAPKKRATAKDKMQKKVQDDLNEITHLVVGAINSPPKASKPMDYDVDEIMNADDPDAC